MLLYQGGDKLIFLITKVNLKLVNDFLVNRLINKI